MQFQKGQSGNPAGRPPGSRNKATVIEELLDCEGEAISRAVIEKAKAGDPTAMRVCMERLIPKRCERTIQFALPPLESVADAVKALAAVAAALADGEITPGEAASVVQVIDGYAQTLGLALMDARLSQIEHTKKEKAKCAG
jgi:Family of unknown function (DUF5681)